MPGLSKLQKKSNISKQYIFYLHCLQTEIRMHQIFGFAKVKQDLLYR